MNKKIVRRYISEIKAICPFRGRGERKLFILVFRIMYGYIVRRMIFRILMNYTDNSVNQMMLSIII